MTRHPATVRIKDHLPSSEVARFRLKLMLGVAQYEELLNPSEDWTISERADEILHRTLKTELGYWLVLQNFWNIRNKYDNSHIAIDSCNKDQAI
jgi:hypothetical protein